MPTVYKIHPAIGIARVGGAAPDQDLGDRHIAATRRPALCAALLALAAVCGSEASGRSVARAQVLLNDQAITLTTTASAQSKRNDLLRFVWGTPSLPTTQPATVTRLTSTPSDLGTLPNNPTVDQFIIRMDGGSQTNFTYHIVPERKNNRLVILNPGHTGCSYADAPADPTSDVGEGHSRALTALLREGYSVLATYMPHSNPAQCNDETHDYLMNTAIATGSPLKYFFEPILFSLNYLKTHFAYQDYNFVGLSGGGWTAVVYAALDPTIKVTVSVAGSVPIFLRSGWSVGDAEQTWSPFYQIAGYPDLYLLGSLGTDRRHVQVLSRGDSCCFGQASTQYDAAAHGPWQDAMRKVERDVRSALYGMGPTVGAGFFRLEIDETIDHHGYSWNAITNTILAELGYQRRPAGAASTGYAFERGLNGNLWQRSPNGWTDTGLPMVGAPAVAENAVHSFDVFYRDPGNALMHAFPVGSSWQTEAMGGQLITDPVVAKAGSNPLFVAGTGLDYRYYFWSIPGNGTYNLVSSTARGPGQPALAVTSTSIDLYVCGFDGALYHLQSNSGTSPSSFSQQMVGGQISGYPTAVHIGGERLVYVRGINTNHLWEAAKTGTGGWIWTDVSGSIAPLLSGSAYASLSGSMPWVHIRDVSGNLLRFSKNGSNWTVATVATNSAGSPVGVGSQSYIRGASGQLWRYDGTAFQSLGGLTNY